MSHISKVQTRISNLIYLKSALNDLGYSFQESGANLTVHIENRTVVFSPQSNGFFELQADWFYISSTTSDKLKSTIEKEISLIERKIKQEYAYSTTLQELDKLGFTLEQEIRDKDEIHLVLTRLGD